MARDNMWKKYVSKTRQGTPHSCPGMWYSPEKTGNHHNKMWPAERRYHSWTEKRSGMSSFTEKKERPNGRNGVNKQESKPGVLIAV